MLCIYIVYVVTKCCAILNGKSLQEYLLAVSLVEAPFECALYLCNRIEVFLQQL